MICGRKQSGGLFSPTWQRAKRGDRHGSAEKKSLPACHRDKITLGLFCLYFFTKKEGIRTRREQICDLRKKTVRWTVFADVATSEARR